MLTLQNFINYCSSRLTEIKKNGKPLTKNDIKSVVTLLTEYISEESKKISKSAKIDKNLDSVQEFPVLAIRDFGRFVLQNKKVRPVNFNLNKNSSGKKPEAKNERKWVLKFKVSSNLKKVM